MRFLVARSWHQSLKVVWLCDHGTVSMPTSTCRGGVPDWMWLCWKSWEENKRTPWWKRRVLAWHAQVMSGIWLSALVLLSRVRSPIPAICWLIGLPRKLHAERGLNFRSSQTQNTQGCSASAAVTAGWCITFQLRPSDCVCIILAGAYRAANSWNHYRLWNHAWDNLVPKVALNSAALGSCPI